MVGPQAEWVDGPPAEPRPFGLFTAAQVVEDAEARWLMGGARHEVDYCGEHGIPHSVFLGRPTPAPGEPMWLDQDRAIALVWQSEQHDTCSGCGSENEPFIRWPGSLEVSVASPAVEVTTAAVEAK